VIETFVLAEMMKLATWSEERYEFFHIRDKEGNEVDIVIEDLGRGVLGIEIKGAATATSGDFAGLRRLAVACGERFRLGLVLYDHDKTVAFGDRLFAVPISTLRG
jgi:uncharacterized protein